mmetsp:Transcript_18948/g.32232  ORF Transcript_18948/g.32232 Transcript_18948/m.32232 type:complete len:684 (-) Transcript_18948:19-2070(-)
MSKPEDVEIALMNMVDDDDNQDEDDDVDDEEIEEEKGWKRKWKDIKKKPWYRPLKKYGMLTITSIIAILVLIICGVTIWKDLTWEGWIAVCTVALVLVLLVNDTYEAHFTMMLGMVILLITTVISVDDALEGFSNSGLATIAVLFIVAKGIELSGILKYVLRYVLRRPRYLVVAQLRLLLPVAVLSAFTNNTPIVAMMVPLVQSWCRQTSFKTSELLMPLSFATILGGTCTLIGTSTNLILVALIQDEDGYEDLNIGFFEVAYVGLPVLVVGMIYILIGSRFLLPHRAVGVESFTSDPREFSAAVRVTEKCPAVGKSIEQAGLRHLPNVYLFEIQRGDEIISAPAPTTILNAGDILYFSGVINSMKAVYEVDGLVPAEDSQVKKIANLKDHIICQAVIAAHSPIVGMSVKEARFRTKYNAAIISVHRAGHRVQSKIGDIVLQPGDTLLLETTSLFIEYNKNNSHFSLVSRLEGIDTVLPKQDILNMLFVAIPAVIMVVVSIINLTSLLAAAFVVSCFYIITRRVTMSQALESIKADLLIIIATGFAIGTGLDNSGASEVVANSVLPAFEIFGNIGVLAGLFILTALLSSFITNAAAVTLMFPIAIQFIDSTGIPVKSVIFTLMIAASSSYATPIGYQTNLLVWGPGGYTSGDFFKFGFPLMVIAGVITVPLAYFLWGTVLASE